MPTRRHGISRQLARIIHDVLRSRYNSCQGTETSLKRRSVLRDGGTSTYSESVSLARPESERRAVHEYRQFGAARTSDRRSARRINYPGQSRLAAAYSRRSSGGPFLPPCLTRRDASRFPARTSVARSPRVGRGAWLAIRGRMPRTDAADSAIGKLNYRGQLTAFFGT